MLFSSLKEINRLISKGMPNMYLKVTIDKNWRSKTFDFLNLKNLYLVSFWKAQAHANIMGF